MKNFKDTITKYIPQGSFIRNVFILTTGTTLAQVITILITPVLTRIYTPNNYGVLAEFTAITTVLSVIACGYYERTIVLPDNDEASSNLFVLSLILSIATSIISLLAVLLFRGEVAMAFKTPELALWLWFIPLSLLTLGFFKAYNYWCIRQNRFELLAKRQIGQSLTSVGAQLVFGIVGNAGSGGLIVGNLIGQLIPTGQLGFQICREYGNQFRINVKLSSVKAQAIRYKQFLIYGAFSELLNSISTMLPVLLIGYYFNTTIVGFFALAQRILFLPAALIGGSISAALLPRAVTAHNNNCLDVIMLKTFIRLLRLIVTPMLLLAICAPNLFGIVFGHTWSSSGQYVEYLVLWIIFQFISSPLAVIFDVLERQKELLLFNSIMITSRLIVLVIGGLKGDIFFTLAVFGIVSTLLYFGLCIWLHWIVGNSITVLIKHIFKSFVLALPFIIGPLIIRLMYPNSYYIVGSTILAFLVFCYFLITKDKNQIQIFGGKNGS